MKSAKVKPYAPECLFAYLSNVAASHSIRAIARSRNVHASTILRQVRRVEDLRENPEWDAILGAMETEFKGAAKPAIALLNPGAFALAALGVKLCDYVSGLAAIRRYSARPGATLVFSESQAAIVWGLEVVHRVDRNVALVVLAHGLFPVQKYTGPKVRQYAELKKQPAEDAILRLNKRHPDLMTAARAAHADKMAKLFSLEGPALDHVRDELPEPLFSLLEMVIRDLKGLEETERALAIPARSGKLALCIALDFADLASQKRETNQPNPKG